MVIALFQIDDKDGKSSFFEPTFLPAEIGIDVTLKIAILMLSNVKLFFNNREFRLSLYTAAKVFLFTKQVELVKK